LTAAVSDSPVRRHLWRSRGHDSREADLARRASWFRVLHQLSSCSPPDLGGDTFGDRQAGGWERTGAAFLCGNIKTYTEAELIWSVVTTAGVTSNSPYRSETRSLELCSS
jgi:hypothetical protein